MCCMQHCLALACIYANCILRTVQCCSCTSCERYDEVQQKILHVNAYSHTPQYIHTYTYIHVLNANFAPYLHPTKYAMPNFASKFHTLSAVWACVRVCVFISLLWISEFMHLSVYVRVSVLTVDLIFVKNTCQANARLLKFSKVCSQPSEKSFEIHTTT